MTTSPPAAGTEEQSDNRWLSRLRWFGAEFLVVLTGVLVALAINSWWETRREHALEQSYLRRLEADLLADSVEFDRHISIERSRGAQARLLIAALNGKTTSADSLIRAIEQVGWATAFSLSPYTFLELQSTGNLRLIRSPAIRTAISTYYYQTINNQELLMDYARDRAWRYATSTSHVLSPELRVRISLEQPIDTSSAALALRRLATVPDVEGLISEVSVSTANLEWNYQTIRRVLEVALRRVRGAIRGV